jgi:hypothetical protein
MEWWQVQELMITTAVIVGLLVPVFGLTYRFLTKPATKKRLHGGSGAIAAELPSERMDRVERQLEDLEGVVRGLVDAAEFDRQLKSGGAREPEEPHVQDRA